MDPVCRECNFDYRSLDVTCAVSRLRTTAEAVGTSIRAWRPAMAAPPLTWSALEYAGHVRDVLLVARERTLHARRETGASVVTMGPDERVAWGEYAHLTPGQVSDEISCAADWLARTWERLSAEDWARTLLYNYPTVETRPLSWLAAHIVHELVHHRLDIERQIRAQD